MSTFVGIRGAASELDLSKKSSHRNNGRRTGSFKNLFMNPSQDDVTSTESTPTNKNANNNRQLLRYCDVAQSPDYRTFLMMRRPPTKIPRRFSDDYDSAESDTSDCSSDDCVVSVETENNLQQVSLNPRTSNGGPPESPPPNKEIHISKRNSDKALAQLNPSDSQALLKIVVTEQKLTKCMRVDVDDTPWVAKQRIIQTLAKKLPDPLNYGLYCKKLGRFLLDHKPLSEYLETGSVATYELRYKRRVFHQTLRSDKESRQLLKMQSATKRKELMMHVRNRNIEKLHGLIRKGVDPNFHTTSGDETPLIAASSNAEGLLNRSCGPNRTCAPVIMALVGGGAHLDFRNRKGLTPVHVAGRTGNVAALKTLLDLGASPEGLDGRELTPLYHCCLLDAGLGCIGALVQAGSKLTCVDAQGWTMLHQVCRYGRIAQLELLLEASDDQKLLNKQNATGNTALHVCALYNQEMCLVRLLKHGADPSICNFANQDAYQVAIVAGNVNLAQLIKDVSCDTTGHPLLTQTTNPPITAVTPIECDSLVPPMDEIVISRRHTVSAASLQKGKPQRPVVGTSFSKPNSSNSTHRYDTFLPPNATLPHSDVSHHDVTIKANDITKQRHAPPVALQHVRNLTTDLPPQIEPPIEPCVGREDVSTDILFIACRDYEAQLPGEVSLKLGDRVTVSSKEVSDGYGIGTVGEVSGRFPLNCVQGVKLRRPRNNYDSYDQISIDSRSETDSVKRDIIPPDMHATNQHQAESDVIPTSQVGISHICRDVTISRGADGYGFVLRGAKSDGPIGKFTPSPSQPGLQYLESVEPGTNAYQAGLRSGDFILKINDADVSTVGHREIVDTIRRAGDPLRMTVVAVIRDNPVPDDVRSVASCSTCSSVDVTQPITGIPHNSTPAVSEKFSRSGSIGSAIGKLDSVLALEDSLDDDYDDTKQTATLRRRPVSRMLRSHDIQDIFVHQRHTSTTTPSQIAIKPTRQSQSLSAATSKRLIRVLPPKLPKLEQAQLVLQESTDDDVTSRVPSVTQHIDEDTSSNQLTTSSFTVSRQSSTKSLPMTSRKPPPAPPQRRSSRLTTTSREEDELRHLVSVTSSPPRSPIAPGVTSPDKPSKQAMSGIAAAVAAMALNRSHNAGKPPLVKPKPESPSSEQTNGESPLQLALAAKRASINQAVDSTSVVKPSAVAKALKKNEEKLSDRITLPPPPPTPPNDVDEDFRGFTLPPPPEHNFTQTTMNDVINLPPPPDDVMGGYPNLPPPSSFAAAVSTKSPLNPPNKFKDHLNTPVSSESCVSVASSNECASNADSGVDDVIMRTTTVESKSNLETMSIVSSLSTVSSEEGSDPGVSLIFDKHKNESITLTKVNFGNAAKPPVAAKNISRDVTKSRPDVTNSRPDVTSSRTDVTKTANSPPKAEPNTRFIASKRVSSWTISEVGIWLTEIGLGAHAQVFAENEIDGSHLPDLGKEELQELGVTRVGHRLNIERSLKKLTSG